MTSQPQPIGSTQPISMHVSYQSHFVNCLTIVWTGFRWKMNTSFLQFACCLDFVYIRIIFAIYAHHQLVSCIFDHQMTFNFAKCYDVPLCEFNCPCKYLFWKFNHQAGIVLHIRRNRYLYYIYIQFIKEFQ